MVHHKVYREFKFSVFNSGIEFDSRLENEQILMQGVVDCAIIDDDGIIIVDFKTDRVTEDTISQLTEKYKGQVKIYADALSRIFNMPVKSAQLYFFGLNRFAEIK